MKGNVIVGQSGGPTAAINYEPCGRIPHQLRTAEPLKYTECFTESRDCCQERYIDLSEYITNELDAELLKRTPAAFLGSCRYKLPEIHENREVYEKIFEILNKLDIEAFIYIGGNDSMDTIKNSLTMRSSPDIRPVSSAARRPLTMTLPYGPYAGLRKRCQIHRYFCKRDHPRQLLPGIRERPCVHHRDHGPECRLAHRRRCTCQRRGLRRSGPDLSAELPFDIEAFGKKVKALLKKKSSVVVAISEGIRLADGRYVCELGQSIDFVDAFGHKQLSEQQTTLQLCRRRDRLQDPFHRAQLPSSASASHCASAWISWSISGRRCGCKSCR